MNTNIENITQNLERFKACPYECEKAAQIIREAHAFGFVTDEGNVREPEKVWYCDYCGKTYAEYINGCHACHFNRPGTSTSVRIRLLVDPSAAEAGRGGK